MKWKTTWILVAFAAVLFAFIVLVDSRIGPPENKDPRSVPLFSFRASEVTNILLRITNQLALRAERPAGKTTWALALPINYPAQDPAINALLHTLEELSPMVFIPQSELTAGKRTLADYGLDVPPASLTLQHNGKRTEIQFGIKTPVGDQVYLQLLDRPGVYLVPAELYDRLPRSFNDWRDTLLFGPVDMSRMDVRAGTRGYSIELTSRGPMLTRPTAARADSGKLTRLLQNVFQSQVVQFVTDNPRVDLDQYGLQPPELEVAFGTKTNDQLVVQFGRSPTNDPTVIYARRMSQTNIVLTSREILDAFQSFGELRDLHLVSIPPTGLESIEVVGMVEAENFIVRRMTNGAWVVIEGVAGSSRPADIGALRTWLNTLAGLEGTIEKDVVTDFKTLYKLDPPWRQYVLRSVVTNVAGLSTNVVVGTLQLGARQDNKVFARRPDEATVYALSPKEVAKLPYEAWQLRDRHVWSFTTNQIVRVTVEHGGVTNSLIRASNGKWAVEKGSGAIISSGPLEEMFYQLGQLEASAWVAKGSANKANYGFKGTGDKISIELKVGDKPQVYVLEFSDDKDRKAPTGLPYAMASAEGQVFIFEFPPKPYFELVRGVIMPLFLAPTSPPQ